jgi:hypothetical protein
MVRRLSAGRFGMKIIKPVSSSYASVILGGGKFA